MGDVTIRVDGLKELGRALRQVDASLPKELRNKLKAIADKVAAQAAAQVPRRTGRTARSVRALASQRGASIAGGTARVEHFAWLEFGGHVGRNRSVSRPYLPMGRYLFPAAEAARDDVSRAVQEAADDMIQQAGLA